MNIHIEKKNVTTPSAGTNWPVTVEDVIGQGPAARAIAQILRQEEVSLRQMLRQAGDASPAASAAICEGSARKVGGLLEAFLLQQVGHEGGKEERAHQRVVEHLLETTGQKPDYATPAYITSLYEPARTRLIARLPEVAQRWVQSVEKGIELSPAR